MKTNINELLEIELTKFKEEIKNNYSTNSVCPNYIYLRLSKIDNRFPTTEEKIKDTLNKLRADFNSLIKMYDNLTFQGFKLFIEVKSAYKNSTRDIFIDLYSNYLFQDISSVRDILEGKEIKTKKSLYVASYDRLSREFLYSLPFQIIRISRGISVYSLLPEEIEFEKKAKDILEKDNQDQLMFVFQLMMFSSSASKHSEDLSGKVKKRVSKDSKGVTISNKTGEKWGRSSTITQSMRGKIIKLYHKFTAQEVSENPKVFHIVDGIKTPISVFTIKKIVQEDKNK